MISSEVVHSAAAEPAAAVEDLLGQLAERRPGQLPQFGLFFCDGLYSLQELATALDGNFRCPLMGCTSGSQIGPAGFSQGGISLLVCFGDELRLQPFLIEPLGNAAATIEALSAALAANRLQEGSKRFGLLLVDGLHEGEERLSHLLYHGLDDLPFVGGSASDEMRFEHTPVYFGGRFRSNAAVFGVFETRRAFMAFRVQHFVPRADRLVITDADPERRLVIQINGLPAAEVYASVLGVAEAKLDAELIESHPLLVRLGEQYVVRAISRVTHGRALRCMSAIEAGVLVGVGDVQSPLAALERGFEKVRAQLGETALVLGCDCTLRRRQAERDNAVARIGGFLAAQNVFGFSTHGEQINGLHVNQTFTAIAVASH
jgi:hypothetical protein